MNARPAFVDEPVFFPAGDETLFGIHTQPAGPRRGVGVVIIAGGDNVNAAMSRNRVGHRLAHVLASNGYDVLQFTYRGVGESTGVVEGLHLHEPFTADVIGATEFLAGRGVDRFVLVGSCFGGRTALSSVALIPDTAGVVAITPPSGGYERSEAMAEWMARTRSLREYAKRGFSWTKFRELLDPGKRRTYMQLFRKKSASVFRQLLRRLRLADSDEYDWVSPMLLESLEVIVERRVPVLLEFGTHDAWASEFWDAAQGPLGDILERGAGLIEVVDDLPGVAHGLVRVRVQEAFLETTIKWLTKHVPGHDPGREEQGAVAV